MKSDAVEHSRFSDNSSFVWIENCSNVNDDPLNDLVRPLILMLVESFHSYLASGYFCRLLITFTNSLDPDQERQNVCPDLDPNHLTL